jgi:hypothetical protein
MIIVFIFAVAIVLLVILIHKQSSPTADADDGTILHFNIAGINYRQGIKNYLGDFTGYIKPEPTNEYDRNAIAIYHSDGHHLGYINSGETLSLHASIKQFPYPVIGHIKQLRDGKRTYFAGLIALTLPNVSPSQI